MGPRDSRDTGDAVHDKVAELKSHGRCNTVVGIIRVLVTRAQKLYGLASRCPDRVQYRMNYVVKTIYNYLEVCGVSGVTFGVGLTSRSRS